MDTGCEAPAVAVDTDVSLSGYAHLEWRLSVDTEEPVRAGPSIGFLDKTAHTFTTCKASGETCAL